MKLYCFFCTTPFQIMTAIHLCKNMKDSADVDLYVVDQFVQADQVAKRIGDIGIFRKVIFIREENVIEKNRGKIQVWMQIALSYLQLNKVAKKILADNWNTHYDAMYISSKAFISRVVALYYAKNEFNTEIVYFDDGLGSYYDKRILQPRWIDRLFRRIILGGKESSIEPQKILLYDVNLFHLVGVNETKNVIVEPIPKWEREPLFIETLNNIFSCSPEDLITEPIVIFDGLYTGEERKLMDDFYRTVADIAGEDNVIIKKHPRDKTETENSSLKYYSRSELPFELICLNSYMNEKLLIALSSTAIITPVLLLNDEPYVLTLNNIEGISSKLPKVHYNDFKNMYKDKNKLFEAHTIKEALDFVERFCGETSKQAISYH